MPALDFTLEKINRRRVRSALPAESIVNVAPGNRQQNPSRHVLNVSTPDYCRRRYSLDGRGLVVVLP